MFWLVLCRWDYSLVSFKCWEKHPLIWSVNILSFFYYVSFNQSVNPSVIVIHCNSELAMALDHFHLSCRHLLEQRLKFFFERKVFWNVLIISWLHVFETLSWLMVQTFWSYNFSVAKCALHADHRASLRQVVSDFLGIHLVSLAVKRTKVYFISETFTVFALFALYSKVVQHKLITTGNWSAIN